MKVTLPKIEEKRPLFWCNPELRPAKEVLSHLPLGLGDIQNADSRLRRFAPLLAELFPELIAAGGVIESDLIQTPTLQDRLAQSGRFDARGKLWIKADHDLPVAGSVKARGGIYEVLLFAESMARKKKLWDEGQNMRRLRDPDVRKAFSGFTVAVGSTGNLGLSIGIMAVSLGFRAVVHMSADAKPWKKQLLREKGVTVVEHAADYGRAVQSGREMAAGDPTMFFVDDENSQTLFLGYSVAALRLRDQLECRGLLPDGQHPLFVYLPCGVGGAPGGIAFGLKQVFGDAVHCFFAEPVGAPCMLIGLLDRFQNDVSIYDRGLDIQTAADGLAVGKASQFAGTMVQNLISGVFTVSDDALFRYVRLAHEAEKLRLEPSAAIGFDGPGRLLGNKEGREYLQTHQLERHLDKAMHLVWTTGGRLVPDAEFVSYLQRAGESV